MQVKKHTKVWYSLDPSIRVERKKFFDTLHHWGIIEQVNVYTFWKEFEENRFDEKILSQCETKVDNAFRRAIDIKENLLRSLELDNSINEQILQNTVRFIETQLKDLTNDHFQIQNTFKDIKANIILKQME
jgi:hypothetical protein